jgi:hypothetical protein
MNNAISGYACNSQAVYEPFGVDLSRLPNSRGQSIYDIDRFDRGLAISSHWMLPSWVIDVSCAESQKSFKAVQQAKNQAAIQLLESWRHGNEQEQRETWEYLTQALGDKTARLAKKKAARMLLQEWLADESGYDEQTWPLVQKAIEENRSAYRSRFSE